MRGRTFDFLALLAAGLGVLGPLMVTLVLGVGILSVVSVHTAVRGDFREAAVVSGFAAIVFVAFVLRRRATQRRL